MSAEEQGSFPAGWTRVRFGDVVENKNLTTKDPQKDALDRIVGLTHLDSESLPVVRWDLLEGETSFSRTFKAGDVLFGKRRAYQRKVGVADFAGICSGDILVFESKNPSLLQEFLPYIVQSDAFFKHALGTSAGSLSPRTNWTQLARFEFALPPLEEQKRVADVQKEYDGTIEAVRAALRAASALKLSVIGEAVPIPLEGGAGPTGTAITDLLLEPPRNGISPKTAPQGAVTVSIAAVQGGRLVVDEHTMKTCEPPSNADRFYIKPNDCFVVRGNGNHNLVARMGIALSPPEDVLYPDLLIRLRFDSTKILPELAVEIWNGATSHGRLLRQAKSSNGIYKINGKDVSSHRIPVPTLDVQHELLRRIKKIQRLESDMTQLLNSLERSRALSRERGLRRTSSVQ